MNYNQGGQEPRFARCNCERDLFRSSNEIRRKWNWKRKPTGNSFLYSIDPTLRNSIDHLNLQTRSLPNCIFSFLPSICSVATRKDGRANEQLCTQRIVNNDNERRRQRARQRINSARETVEGILARIRDKVSRPGEVNFHVSPCYLTKENAG